jgi:TonB family protein
VHQKTETPKPPKIEEPTKHWYDSLVGTKTKAKEPVQEPTPPPKHKIDLGRSDLAMHKSTERSTNKDDANNKEAKRQASKAIGKTVADLKKDLHSGSQVEIPNPGVGGDGQATADFGDVLISKYFNAWSPPVDLDNDVPVVTVSVTIARDGSVMSAHIISPSGNKSLDRSIQNALDSVAFIAPFPPSWKEGQRTVKVKFNIELKRQTG